MVTKLLPILQQPALPDEPLITEMNRLSVMDRERRQKFTTQRTQVSLMATAEATTSNQDDSGTATKPVKKDKLLDTIEIMCGQLSSLQKKMDGMEEQLDEMRTPQFQRSETPRRSQWKCESCMKVGAFCNHCFNCGSAEHFARGCRQKRSGNG